MVDKSQNTCKMSDLGIQMTARPFMKHQSTGFERMYSLSVLPSYCQLLVQVFKYGKENPSASRLC